MERSGTVLRLFGMKKIAAGACLMLLVALPTPTSAAPSRSIAFSIPTGSERGIYTVAPDGSGRKRLTQGRDEGPLWSPDHRRIAFVRWQKGKGLPLLMVMDANGGGRRQLARLGMSPVGDLHWSPDSRKLVYSAQVIDTDEDLFVVNVVTGKRTHLTTLQGSEFLARWSPDGQQIAFVRFDYRQEPFTGSDIYVVSAPGADIKTEPEKIASSSMNDASPEFSPDGRYLAFTSARDHSFEENESENSNDVYTFDLKTETITRLTDSVSVKAGIDWGPGSDILAYQATCYADVCNQKGDVRAVRLDGSDSYALSANKSRDGSPSWSPNGRRLVYVRTVNGDSDLVIASRDGARRRVLLGGSQVTTDPDWQE